MRVHLLAVGTKMPAWVDAGYREYADRLRGEIRLDLREIPAEKRTRSSDVARVLAREGERLLAAVPKNCAIVALDVLGTVSTTEQLAGELGDWMSAGRDIAMLIGGPEGLASACLTRADKRISLSALTFPHPLVRVIIAEQLYRAHSLLRNHPYHRAG
ncbi:MAG: 23S rRNA (pseudouridine(1915)-N(3))-methyltransferase RlmH [Pseudomonadota bacterium]